jgi:predicted NACHT family NTPase
MPAILKVTGQEIVKNIISNSLKRIKPELFESKISELDKLKNNFPKLYENHFNTVYNWAFSIPFLGLSKPKNTELSTIELLIASDIIGRKKGDIVKISEDEILNSDDNILLVGAPGAGKTTTLKRLVIKYLSEISRFDKYGFPILVRLREMPTNTTLAKYILDIFNIKYENKTTEEEVTIKTIEKASNHSEGGNIRYDTRVIKTTSTYVGDVQIDLFLAKFLNTTQALLMLDGLDEVDKTNQNKLLRDIESLGLQLNKSKILLTVRKSELNKLIDNFTIYDISPLTTEQIEIISDKWLGKGSKFIEELNNKPYTDLANRPIFLTLLMILYAKYKYLPTKPSEVYEDATQLIVKEWDDHRDIIRNSKYGDFNVKNKLRFLSEVSYLLTYEIKQKVFTSNHLKKIYIQISEKYGLPSNEMDKVVSEVESHTGIIVESTYKHFEFSHLSIQEFLCAQHLVNLPYSAETISYFLEYPEPLAIAVSISAEPSLWLANLLLNSSLNINNFKTKGDAYYSSIYTLLNRILTENPSFKKVAELGFTFLYLTTNLYKEDRFVIVLDMLFKYPGVKESLSLALKGCTYQNLLNGFYLITRKEISKTKYFIDIPHISRLPSSYLEELMDTSLITLNKSSNTLS